MQVEHPELGKSFVYAGAPYQLPKSPWAIRRRPPLLGEHNREVYIGAARDVLRKSWTELQA